MFELGLLGMSCHVVDSLAHPGRPVHRAVSRQAHLRHPGAAGLRCAGAGRPAAAADRAVQCATAPRPGSHPAPQARGRPLRGRNHPRHALRCRRGGDRRRRGIVPAAAYRRARRGTVRGQEHPLPRARRGELPRQETGDFRRRRFGARLGHRLRRQGRGRHAGAPARGIQGGAGLGGQDEGARGGRSGAVHRRSGRVPADERRRLERNQCQRHRRHDARHRRRSRIRILRAASQARSHRRMGHGAGEESPEGRHRKVPDQHPRHLRGGRHQHLSG